MVLELGRPQLVDKQALESGVEKRKVHENADHERRLVVVHEQACEEQAEEVEQKKSQQMLKGLFAARVHALVEHDKTPTEAGHTVVGDGDREEKNDAGGSQVEEHEDEEELPELDQIRDQTDEAVDNAA